MDYTESLFKKLKDENDGLEKAEKIKEYVITDFLESSKMYLFKLCSLYGIMIKLNNFKGELQ